MSDCTPRVPTAKQIVRDYLFVNNYAGMAGESCGCSRDEFPMCEWQHDCRPANFQTCDDTCERGQDGTCEYDGPYKSEGCYFEAEVKRHDTPAPTPTERAIEAVKAVANRRGIRLAIGGEATNARYIALSHEEATALVTLLYADDPEPPPCSPCWRRPSDALDSMQNCGLCPTRGERYMWRTRQQARSTALHLIEEASRG